jgi:N-acetylmuramoyl-L-alanine amidase
MTDHDIDILARTIYGEARGEYTKTGLTALIAVANVILNRLKAGKYGTTLTQVCLKPRQFSCWNKDDLNLPLIQGDDLETDPLFAITKNVAKKVASGLWPDVTRASDHYHTTSCKPYWAKASKVRVRLGKHVFYKLD